jgi:hypothetical protein
MARKLRKTLLEIRGIVQSISYTSLPRTNFLDRASSVLLETPMGRLIRFRNLGQLRGRCL